MKKEPFIQIPEEILEHPIVGRLVEKEGAMFLGTYAVLLLYLSRRPNCVGSLNNLTLRLLAARLRKSVTYVRHVIFDTGLFRADEERNAFTSPYLQRSFGIPETLGNGVEAPGSATQTPGDAPEEDSTEAVERPSEREEESSREPQCSTEKEVDLPAGTKHPVVSKDHSGSQGQDLVEGSDGSTVVEDHPQTVDGHSTIVEDHPQTVDSHPSTEGDLHTGKGDQPSAGGNPPTVEGENPTDAEEGSEGSKECFETARKPLANATEIHLGMNHDAFGIDSKLNANSIFVRVPYIRARINRDKDKNINLRKKESTSSTQKKNAAVAADDFFNFGFYSVRTQKNGARAGGVGGRAGKGPSAGAEKKTQGGEEQGDAPSGPSPPVAGDHLLPCKRSSERA